MKPATFEPTLQPCQPPGKAQAQADAEVQNEESLEHYASSNPQAAPEIAAPPLQTRETPHIQFVKPAVAVDAKADFTPTSLLSASPNSNYPTYRAGVVQSVGKALPPPPAMPGASPLSGMSPILGGASPFTSFTIPAGAASPGAVTPPRRQSSEPFSPATTSRPSRTPHASPSSRTDGTTSNRFDRASLNSMDGSSPSRKQRTGGERRGNQASRIDPDQVPRPSGPVEVLKEEAGKVYYTDKYHIPPPATAVCTIVDKGSCSCEFIRTSVNQVPAFPSTANTAHVPMVVVCQPFAELTASEDPVPVVDFGEAGPFRCTRCHSYVNPYFHWHDGGREATCNFCGHRNQVPADYFFPLDDHGRRRDYDSRPELQRGTVDYIAPRDYSDTLPGVPVTCFVIEASQRSVKSGLLPQVMWTLRSLLGFIESPARIALITFDQSLQFYAFHPGLGSARSVRVSDVEDPFVPCSPNTLCVNVDDDAYRGQFEALLEELPAAFLQSTAEQVAGGSALRAAVDLVASAGGGHVMMFHASLPNCGPGALRHRDDLRLAARPDEGGLFTSQQAAFYDNLTSDCLSSGVAVSVFCAPPVGAYIDMASLSAVPKRTGGDICHMPGFDPTTDGERLHYDISRMTVQSSVYSCAFKLRCSKGLTVDSMYAAWEPEVIDQSTFNVSRLSVDATVDFVVSHSERIEGQKNVYLQAACLHTDRRGRRLIRIHTLQLPVTSSLSNVFRYTEVDAVTNLLLKEAASAALSGNGFFKDSTCKDKLVKSCVDMLHAYRVNCASMTSAGQLILPESLKLLPLFVGSIRKMAAFRSGSDIRVDDRVASLTRMLSLPIAQTAPFVYPRIFTLWPLSERAGLPTHVGDNVFMPPTIACSSDKLASDRVYLFDNGMALRLYVREDVPADVLLTLFGTDNRAALPAALSRNAEELSPEAVRVFAIVQQIRRERIRLPWQPLSIVVPGTPEEARLLGMVCEDALAGEKNYVDFLCHVHRMVQNKQD